MMTDKEYIRSIAIDFERNEFDSQHHILVANIQLRMFYGDHVHVEGTKDRIEFVHSNNYEMDINAVY